MNGFACTAAVLIGLLCGAAAVSAQAPEDAGRSSAWWPERWSDTAAPLDQSVAFCLYTTHEGTLKLTAQLYPLPDGVDRAVVLEARRVGSADWAEVSRVDVDETLYGWPQETTKRWLAHFRVDGWDMASDYEYRVTAAGGAASFEGLIRKDPVEKDEIVVASLSCNSNQDRGPRADIIANLLHQDPDLVFFAGDQSYDHRFHYEAWLLFGRQFRDIMRDRPTITIPDDHDIGQGNLWGEGGIKADDTNGDSGGYFFSPEYVNSVQAAQCWHLPDPFDATPIGQGIGVYYTDLTVGGVGFAVIEDRKFKTGPKGLFSGFTERSDHFNSPDFDPASVNIREAELLGDRQIEFLRAWSRDWTGHEMKAVLSQTVFANAQHRSGPGVWGGSTRVNLRRQRGKRLVADLDSNGWPQHGRDSALIEIRKGFATMLAGDQHLATLIHHGVNEFGDAGVSFVSPSIVNYYVRWWDPIEPALRPIEGLPHLGDYRDGFGNKVTMLGYVNPDPDRVVLTSDDGNHWGPRAEGYGLVRFDKGARTMTYEVWPRMSDVTEPGARPYEGWPITRSQMDQYGRSARGYLPTISVEGMDEPVVEVIEEANGETVYTLRINGGTFQPHVFAPGLYTVRVSGQPGPTRVLRGLPSTSSQDRDDRITLSF
ncbi:MAG: hypothetical protein AAF297_11285 [Planctomycetota bacterium]